MSMVNAKLRLAQVLIALSALVVIDLLLWAAFPVQDGVAAFAQLIRPNIPGVKAEVTYATIGRGFRSETVKSPDKKSAAFRILCVGASTTEQSVQSTSDTWCAKLKRNVEERLLAEGRKLTVEALSYGQSGIGSAHVAFWLWKEVDRVKPDVVVTLLGINDLIWFGGTMHREFDLEREIAAEKEYVSFKGKLTAKGLKRLCVTVSQICRRAQLAKSRLAAGFQTPDYSVENGARVYRSLPMVSTPDRDPDPIEGFEEGLRYIGKYLSERQVPFVFLGQPVLWRQGLSEHEYNQLWFPVNTRYGRVRAPLDWFDKEMERFNSVQERVASQFGAKYLNLNGQVPKTLEYFYDDCHFTDRGSYRVADAATPSLMSVVESFMNREMKAPSSKQSGLVRGRPEH